jgi:hypothetical protein
MEMKRYNNSVHVHGPLSDIFIDEAIIQKHLSMVLSCLLGYDSSSFVVFLATATTDRFEFLYFATAVELSTIRSVKFIAFLLA